MKVIAIEPDSPLFGRVRKGYELVGVNGESVRDNLDCRFKLAEDVVILDFNDTKGRAVQFRVRNESYSDIGLRFEPDKVKTCRNKCIFCFVHQQPKGMRRALYVRDDDYRLSFTHGNFISLSNVTDEDMERIVNQRLSPLYVSVHTTDDGLRRKMFGNKRLPSILPQLKYLSGNKIEIHTQVVLCPGINDSEHFYKTVDDLYSLYPGAASLGVVPIGLTKYRASLPKINSFDKGMAINIIDIVNEYQRSFLADCGSRFIFAADEFYIIADRNLPDLTEYEQISQFENGIGMMRHFLTDFNRKKRFLKGYESKKRILVVTGHSAYGILRDNVISYLNEKTEIPVDILPVKNRFWGDKVTASGLLTGRDIVADLKKIGSNYDIVLLPPNCLNDDGLFLDDLPISELRRKFDMDIRVGSYSMIDTIREVIN